MFDVELARRHYREREAQRLTEREAERQHWLQRTREAIRRVAQRYPTVRRVYLFGSIVQAGRFRPDSDIDVAVECDTVETESAFWRDLERELKRDVDLRPLVGDIAEAVLSRGEQVYG